MESLSINKRTFLLQFLIWWGIYFVFVTGVVYFPHRLAGREHGPVLHDIIIGIECTSLGALMAISHYYLLYRRYFTQKKYLAYVALAICFIGLFVLLDNVLFYFQIGSTRFWSDKFSRLLFINFERVMYAYVPVVLVYTFFRNYQIKRKERKNN